MNKKRCAPVAATVVMYPDKCCVLPLGEPRAESLGPDSLSLECDPEGWDILLHRNVQKLSL